MTEALVQLGLNRFALGGKGRALVGPLEGLGHGAVVVGDEVKHLAR